MRFGRRHASHAERSFGAESLPKHLSARLLERFRPSARVTSVTEIDAAALRKQGFEGLFVDLDNTLLPWKDWNLPDSSKQWIESAKKAGMKPALVSNTHYPKRLDHIASELGIPAIAHSLKPRRHGFEEAAALVGCELKHAVVVGDQLLTDTWGGNRVGAYTILVNPVHRREFVGTKVSRMVERVIFRLLGLPVRQGTNAEAIKSDNKDTK